MESTLKITPFWNRIPRFFLYGFKSSPLALAGICFAVSLFFGGPIINFVLYLVAIKYGSEVLKQTMEGDLDPPKLTSDVINANFGLPFKLMVVFIIYFFALGAMMGTLGPVLAIPVYIAMMLLIPSVIIAFVVSEEIFYALNPANWFHIAFRIGWPYLLMVLFIVLSNGMPYLLAVIADVVLPDSTQGAFLMGINVYYMAVVFHLMGYVAMQYSERLGVGVPTALIAAAHDPEEGARNSPLLQQFLADGNIVAAAAEMESLIKINPEDMEMRRRLYVFLKANGLFDRLKEYAVDYFHVLADKHYFNDAALIYLESLERKERIVPDTAAHYLPLLQELRRRRANKQAVVLSQGFHKNFPDDPHTPDLYLELARILSEELHRDDLAQQALAFVLKKFPQHETIPRIKEYLMVLSRLNGAAQPG